jgi:argininosuccinate lyase
VGGELIVLVGESTGMTVAAEAPDRDRAFLTYVGVNAVWDASMVPTDMLAADHVLLCDYFAAPGMQGESTRALLAGARAAGAVTYFDTAGDPLEWPVESQAEIQALLPLVDVFLPNEREAIAIAGGAPGVRAAARTLQAISGGWVVVKRGADGCIAAGPDGAMLSAAAEPVELVDSTGAGDAFNAGLIAAFARGAGWQEALEAGTSLASSIVSRPLTGRHTARRMSQ